MTTFALDPENGVQLGSQIGMHGKVWSGLQKLASTELQNL